MKIGVWVPDQYLHSVHVYYDQVSKHLIQKGVEIIPFSKNDALPEHVDIYWDPTCTGGKNPNLRFLKRKKPLVATVHGASNFALPHHYTYHGWKNQCKGYWTNFKRKLFWNFFRKNLEGIITVSDFAKREITEQLHLDSKEIEVIHHGYRNDIFNEVKDAKRDYLFHISVFQPIKNIDTLLKAYQQADPKKRLPLKLVVPRYPHKIDIDGVELITTPISQQEVAQYMQHARAFFLPSIRESFGLPIIEAMATGTPVVVSQGSACEEIAKGYGILCHPLRVNEWTTAIEQISTDENLWEKLNQKSIERAKDFSWEISAEKHFLYFQSLI